MTRPTILDLDMAITPRKIVPLPYDLQDDFCDDPSCEHGCAEMRQERDEFNRKHNGPDPAWDEVRKYVEGLERENTELNEKFDYDRRTYAAMAKTMQAEHRAEAAEARIAELEKEKHAALTMIAMLEKQLAGKE